MSACQSRIRLATFFRVSRSGISSPSWMSSTSVATPSLLVARFDFGLAPLRQRSAGLREMADVAVGQRDELDLVPLRREERRRPRKLQLGIVRMRAERDDAQLPRCGCLCDDARRMRSRRRRGTAITTMTAIESTHGNHLMDAYPSSRAVDRTCIRRRRDRIRDARPRSVSS